MASVSTDPVLRFIRKLAVRDRAVHLTDCELLQAFLTKRDDSAFAALVSRHGAMVLRVCQNVLQNEHDAEDAFQATFLVLSRKAASVRKQQSVGSWLFGVAQRVATNLLRSRGRQRTRDSRVDPSKTVDPLADISVREAQAILYEELNRLPEKYRSPLVLCSLEGMTRDEAAHHLGLPLPTLKNRLDWARKRLRERLTARGVGLLGASIGAIFCEQAVSAAVPLALLNSTINAATTVAVGGAATSVVSAKVAALTEGVVKTMYVTKLKTVMAMLLLVGMLGAGVGTALFTSRTQAQPTAKDESSPATIPRADDATKEAKELEGEWQFVELEKDGKKVKMDGVKDARIVFMGNEMTISLGGKDNKTKFTLNPGKSPKEIDFIVLNGNKDQTQAGIYSLEKGQLKLCMGEFKGKRPKNFKTEPGDGLILNTLKRVKPAPKEEQSSKDVNKDKAEVVGSAKDGVLKLEGPVASAVWSSDGKLFASISIRKVRAKEGELPKFDSFVTVRIHDGRTGKELHSLGELKNPHFSDCKFSPDGSLLALSRIDDKGEQIELWDTAKAAMVRQVELEYARVKPVLAFLGKGKTLAVSYGGLRTEPMKNGACIVEVSTGKLQHTLAEAGCSGRGLACSPDGKLMATGDYSDGQIRIWSVEKAKLLKAVDGVNGEALVVAFSPDGKTLACGSTGNGIQRWDVATYKPMPALDDNPASCSQLVFSPDSRLIAGASPGPTPEPLPNGKLPERKTEVRIWDATSGKLLFTHSDASDSFVFAPDGRTLDVLAPSVGIRRVNLESLKK